MFVAGVLFNAAIAIFAIGTVRLREATGEVLPRHEFSLHPLKRMTSWSGDHEAHHRARETRETARAQQRQPATGEFKKIDVTETPDREPRIEVPTR